MRTPLFLVIALALGTVGCDQKTPEQTPPPAPTAATPAPAAPTNPAPVADATPAVAAAPATTMMQARVELASMEGQTARGTLSLERAASGPGVTLYGNLEGLSPNGTHAFHIHENGDCSAPDGSSAGGHFNPDGKPHGHPNEANHHVGDMLSVKSDATGAGAVDALAVRATLGDGAPTDVLGKAVIVHAQGDDYTTQPTGDAGGRIACGVITKVGD